MSFTYAQLKTAIKDYTQNEETTFVANLPLFIRFAEERVLKTVQLNVFRKNVTASATAANQYLACPSDFLAPMSLSYTASGDKNFMDFKDVTFVQTYNSNPSSTGLPRYYAQFDVDNFVLAPTPTTSYVMELHYLYRPASLTAGAEGGTTWLSENAELTLLYGSLVEAYIFMKGEQDINAEYQKRYNDAMGMLKQLGEGKNRQDMYRTPQARYPVQ